MDEITLIMSQFQTALRLAISAEVQRQISAEIAALPTEDVQPTRARKPYAKSPPKPCPTCGVLNMARRFRYHCAEHRT